jgi:hypothetical protein
MATREEKDDNYGRRWRAAKSRRTRRKRRMRRMRTMHNIEQNFHCFFIYFYPH